MTIRQHLAKHLNDNGLLPGQVNAIMDILTDRKNDLMARRWDDDVTGYLPSLLITLQITANAEAVKWIDANEPQHWARAVLAPTSYGEHEQ